MKKKVCSILAAMLAVLMILTSVPFGAFAADDIVNPEENETNLCGETAVWTLENGKLTISGTGSMYDYTETASPFAEAVQVVIEEGIAYIGTNAFNGCAQLTSVTIPKSVTAIGDNAFSGCSKLEAVKYCGSEEDWASIVKGADDGHFAEIAITYNYCSHNLSLVEVVEATCGKNGNTAYYKCSACQKLFADEQASIEITETETVIPATGEHQFTTYTPNDENDTHSGICAVCGAKSEAEACAWNEGTVTTEATCGADGVKEFTCTVCGRKRTETLPATDEHKLSYTFDDETDTHSGVCEVCSYKTDVENCTWNEGEVTTEATCSATGVKVYTCTVCGGTKTETIPATGKHNISYTYDAETGTHSGTCSVCSYETDVENCAWNEGTVTEESTCGKDGVKVYTCTECDGTKTEVIPATGKHDISYTYDAETGTHSGTCSVCSYETDVENCAWNEGTVTIEATCGADGVKACTCTVCGGEKTEVIPATGKHSFGTPTDNGDSTHQIVCSVCGAVENPAHDYTAKSEKTEPTCILDGYTTNYCACGVAETVIDENSATGHNFTAEKAEAEYLKIAATCKTPAVYYKSCSVCGTSSKESENEATFEGEIDPNAHAWKTEYTIDIEPTCTNAGSQSIHCSLCGEKKEITPIPVNPENHVWEEDYRIDVNPTCKDEGSKSIHCSLCDEKKALTSVPVDPENHDWKTEPEIDVEPTCSKEGLKSIHCSRCDAKKDVEVIEKLPHTESEWIIDKEATCAEKGTKHKQCTVCNEVLEPEEIPEFEHTPVAIPAVDPTCEETGLTEGSKCSVCGKILVEQIIIEKLEHQIIVSEKVEPTCTDEGYTVVKCTRCGLIANADKVAPLGHEEVIDEKVEPTCTEAGLSEGKHCAKCNAVLVAQEKVEPLGHIENWVVDIEPACEKEGRKYCKCGRCNEFIDIATIPALEHIFTKYVSDGNATCFADGTKTAQCDNDCGETKTIADEGSMLTHSYTKYVSNNDATCTDDGTKTATCDNGCGETNTVADEGSALGHSFTNYVSNNNASCTANGTETAKCDRCDVTDTRDIENSMLAHTLEAKPDTAVAATCTTDGKEADTWCTVCENTIEQGAVLPATGHSGTWVLIKDATCTEQGSKYRECTVCGETETVVIEANGHRYPEEWTVKTEATCKAAGEETRTCEVCNYTDSREIAKLEHTPKTLAKVEPACEKTGLTEGSVCSVCGETLVAQNVIPALAHKYVWTVTKKATCKETGIKTAKCSLCSKTVTQTIAKSKTHGKTSSTVTAKATEKKAGTLVTKCTVCGKTVKTEAIAKIKSIKLAKTSYSYDGKAKKPSAVITDSNNKKLKSGTDYTISYKANKAIGKATATITFKGKYSGKKSLTFKIVLGLPSAVSVTQTKDTVKLIWGKVPGATGYRVYRYDTKTKKYVKIADTKSTNYTISKLKSGTSYKFAVKAYKKADGKTIWSTAYKTISTATKPAKTNLKATAGKKQAKLSWTKVTGTGYEIYMKTGKDGKYKKIADIKGASKLSYTKKGLSSGKTYYFKVKAYKTVGNAKIYGSYSAVRSIKAK